MSRRVSFLFLDFDFPSSHRCSCSFSRSMRRQLLFSVLARIPVFSSSRRQGDSFDFIAMSKHWMNHPLWCSSKNPCQRVVSSPGIGSKLVIVASAQTDCQSRASLADRVQLLIDHIHFWMSLVLKLVFVGRVKGKSRQSFFDFGLAISVLEQVACDFALSRRLVVRQIAIESVNHHSRENAKRFGTTQSDPRHFGFSKTHDIQPMPPQRRRSGETPKARRIKISYASGERSLTKLVDLGRLGGTLIRRSRHVRISGHRIRLIKPRQAHWLPRRARVK